MPCRLINQLIAKASLVKGRLKKSYAGILSASGFIAAVAVVLVLWFGLNNPRSIPPIRVGEFWSAVVLSFTHATPYWLVRTIVVLAIVAGGFIVGNLWCRFACPTGGLLELIRRFSVFRVYKTGACNDCDKCLKVCEMKTRPDEINCTNCGDCIGSCPVGAIESEGNGRDRDDIIRWIGETAVFRSSLFLWQRQGPMEAGPPAGGPEVQCTVQLLQPPLLLCERMPPGCGQPDT